MADSEVIRYRSIDEGVRNYAGHRGHCNKRVGGAASADAVHVTAVTTDVVNGIRAWKRALFHVHCLLRLFVAHVRSRYVLGTMVVLDDVGNTDHRHAQRKPDGDNVS